MSDHQAHSSAKADNTPETSHHNTEAGGIGFDEELISSGANIQRALSSAGDTPPDPKTVLQMQSTLGNRTTIQLVNKTNPKAKLQRKKKDGLPFGGLRMIQRNSGDVQKEIGVDEQELKKLEELKQNGLTEKDVQHVDFSDEPMEIKGNPNGSNSGNNENVQEVDFSDEPMEIKGNPNGGNGGNNENAQVVDFSDEPMEIKGNVQEVDFSDEPLEIKGDAKGGDAKSGDAKGDAKKGFGDTVTGKVLKNMANTTIGFGSLSIMGFVDGLRNLKAEKQEALYGDNWKAWTFLEQAVNFAQVVADVSASVGFITTIGGAITSVVAPPAAPILLSIAAFSATVSTISHIVAGVGRLILSIKLATRLSELEPNSKEHAMVKGTMYRQIIGTVANTIGAVTGGLSGAFSPRKAIAENLGNYAATGGWKAALASGGKDAMTGQLKGGTSGDIGNYSAENATEDMVNRSPIQRALTKFGEIQRKGGDTQEAIDSIDKRLKLIRKVRADLTEGLGGVKESEGDDQEKKALRKQQLEGIQQGLPEMEKLDKAGSDVQEEGKKAEADNKRLEDTINAQEPPQEEKDKSLWGRIKSAAKAAFRKLMSVFNAIKRKVLGFIANLKAKLTNLVMSILGVSEPAQEVKQTMQDKQKELPEALAQQDTNQQDVNQIKGKIGDGMPKLDKAEKQGEQLKQQLQEQQAQEDQT